MVRGGLAPPPAEDEARRERSAAQGVVFVLEGAQLEVAQVGRGYQLLNSDDHGAYLARHGLDPARYRPDVAHQALMTILDSPLNKSGKVKAVWVHTAKGALISVHPRTRLPRTYKRFAGLMVQLIQKLSVRAADGPDKLLRVVKGPVSRHLPPGAPRVGFSHAAGEPRAMHEAVRDLPEDQQVVFVLGAFAHGRVDAPYVDRYMSVSAYPLSAAYAIARITGAMEQMWGVV